ncbi:MAG: ABC transporter permease [Fidelibacterota bacterium]
MNEIPKVIKKKRGHLKNTLRESYRMTLDAIRNNKLRSILTLLGISIGVFSVIGVMTAIRTLESSIESGLNVFGTNTFTIQKWPAINVGGPRRNQKYRNRENIDFLQYSELKKRAQLPIMVSVSEGTSVHSVKYKNRVINKRVDLAGGDGGTLRGFNTFIGDGRDLIQSDVDFSRNVCVLGMDVVDQLFPYEDPLGKTIQVNGLDYHVVGIAQLKGTAFGQSQDNYILIPISIYLQRYADRWTSLSITVEAPSEELYDKTMDETVGILRMIRKVPPGAENDFEVISNAELMNTFSQFTGGVKMFALAISIIALVVAGIGIMNIMLVSVTERIKEIGIRKAVGATRQDILTQFLTEAVFLSEFGGIAGVIFGILGGNVIALVLKVPTVIPFDWAFYGLAVCSIIGIGFGIYPAWRAASLNPIDSLHYD